MNKFLQESYWKTATPESVKEEIKKGTNLKGRDKNGMTPLMYASMHTNDPEIIGILIDEERKQDEFRRSNYE